MDWASIAFAFSAGIVAFFSPCAFPMLPAYISYYLGLNEGADKTKRNITVRKYAIDVLKKGLASGLACATGAIAVLSLIGIGVSYIGSLIVPYIPLMSLIVGIILIAMGILMFSNVSLSFGMKARPRMERGFFSLFAYGALYSLAGAGCTAPLFIGVIIQALSKGGFLSGMTVFIAYAAGLALFLIIVTLLITGAKKAIIIKMKRAIPYIGKIGGLILLIVGTWLILQYFFPTLI